MVNQVTIDKLHEMHLSAMAEAFRDQCDSPRSFENLSFEERFGFLVDKEWSKRKSTRLQKLIRSAHFRYPNACVEDIEYHPDRKLDKAQMLEFANCNYVSESHHIILKGASGNGKTYIACALGIAACKNFIRVSYVRLPDLLNELTVAYCEGTFKKVISSYQKTDLLILDEFLLSPVSIDQASALLEIIEARSIKGSVIFCTQFEAVGWYTRIGNESNATLTEAIIDRIVHNAYTVTIEGRVSMRERYGLNAPQKRGKDA